MSIFLEPRLDIHLGPDDLTRALADDARSGLTSTPKRFSPMWLYDDRGCELFERITALPEYYPTRAERSILDARVAEIAARTGADTLVELGSGTSEKTVLLLDALAAAGSLRRIVPFDVSESTLRDAGTRLAARYAGVEVRGVVGDFAVHLPLLPAGGRRLVAFLGSTIGNLLPPDRHRLLRDIGADLRPGDAMLLGTDLVKDPARLIAAYDDPGGVTAAFTMNALARLNAELDADADLVGFEADARWDTEEEWMELGVRSLVDQVVHVRAIDLDVHLAEGELVRTEVSSKFRREGLEREMRAAGLRIDAWWTDPAGDYALSLAVPIA